MLVPPSTTATIIDDDRATVGIARIANGVEAAIPTNALFRVTQTAAASVDTVVSYTLDGTAISGTDFTAASGTVSFADGETTRPISIAVTTDNIVELDESFTVTLSSPGANASPRSQTTA